MNEFLILVDENDNPVGAQEKILVHQQGLLHRAFSVFLFNSKGELLLQQRADDKYHSAGLWTNTCCSHPRFGENIDSAVNRRLFEEMGLKCKTNYAFSFIYKAVFENGLTEHEYDNVYVGITDDLPITERSEVKSWKYLSLQKLKGEIEKHPDEYTQWIKICLARVIHHVAHSFIRTREEISIETI